MVTTMPRKPTRGGSRPGAGRPVTTGMASTPPIHYRVSAEQYDDLTREGKRRKLSPNQEAKRRAFACAPQRGQTPCKGHGVIARTG